MPNLLSRSHPARGAGFSLVEVVIATGLCTYALLVIASLLPLGLGMFQSAQQQIVDTEIFNQQWSKYNTTPFYNLQNANNGASAVFATPTQAIYTYYDADGQDITPSGASPAAPAGTVYIVRASLVNSVTKPSLGATVPAVDGGQSSTGAALNFIRVDIGFHFDPVNLAAGTSDPRVTTRTFLIAKRDTWNGS
jgi:uncharacterized protein (TIGR02598 family)